VTRKNVSCGLSRMVKEESQGTCHIGNVSVTILQLSNIAWKVSRELQTRREGRTDLGRSTAMKMWGREYQKGWAPRIWTRFPESLLEEEIIVRKREDLPL
jgi:hypothetical protein